MARSISFSLFFFFQLVTAWGVDPKVPFDAERAAGLHREFTFESFAEHPAASAPISLDDPDYELLAAAVFHETNRRRAAHDLPALAYRRELLDAAAIQAQGMKRAGAVSHHHPDQEMKTLGDRVEHVGLRPAFAAENVAMTFGIRYESGRQVVPREGDDGPEFSYKSEGEAIEAHSHLSFAENLLDQWMDSPGHRKNILHEKPEELGTANIHGKSDIGMDVFYSVQVFFTKLDVPPGTKAIEGPAKEPR